MSRPKIHRVSSKKLTDVIDRRTPLGLFLTKEGRKWVAVDNSTGDAWTEDFDHKRQAICWLRGEFEVGSEAKSWTRISTPRQLAAKLQGLKLRTAAADMILGYLEGHDFCLMTDGSGMTVRHDEQYQSIHRGNEPYTVLDAIEFCQEMNEELLACAEAQSMESEEYLSRLRRDEKILSLLMTQKAHELH